MSCIHRTKSWSAWSEAFRAELTSLTNVAPSERSVGAIELNRWSADSREEIAPCIADSADAGPAVQLLTDWVAATTVLLALPLCRRTESMAEAADDDPLPAPAFAGWAVRYVLLLVLLLLLALLLLLLLARRKAAPTAAAVTTITAPAIARIKPILCGRFGTGWMIRVSAVCWAGSPNDWFTLPTPLGGCRHVSFRRLHQQARLVGECRLRRKPPSRLRIANKNARRERPPRRRPGTELILGRCLGFRSSFPRRVAQ